MDLLKGREKIVINANKQEFLNDPSTIFNNNFDNILSIHNKNVNEMKELIDIYKGKQNIFDKVRPDQGDPINNKVSVNYATEFVNFKKGYYIGKPIKYVDNKQENSDGMEYLNKYLKSDNVYKQSKDMIKYENLFITGLAYSFTQFKNKDGKEIDTEKESPFEYYILNNETTFAVYSNDIFNTLLFTCCISTIKNEETHIEQPIYTCYFYGHVATVTKVNGVYESIIETYPLDNPINEYSLNQYRIGLFETVISIFNGLNKIRSNQLDLQEEYTNSYLLFENVDWKDLSPKISEMKKNRAIAVTSKNGKDAHVSSINFSESGSSSNDTYKSMEQIMYDIVGVPMATSNTGQGVSGEAQVYGGGWENAQTIATVDTDYILQFERKDLEKFIDISNSVVESKTKDINANDIDIKYTINKSNNMMVKAQSAKYFYDMNVPKELILEWCEISPDAYSQAIQWQNYENNKKQEDINLDVEKQKKLDQLN